MARPEIQAQENVRRDWSESATLLVCALIFVVMPDRYTVGPTLFGVISFGLLVLAASAAVIACIVVVLLSRVIDLELYHAGRIVGFR